MENLLLVQEKWGSAYPKAVQPWLEKWELLAPFFDYPVAIRKVMYTTNTVVAFHRQLRKVTKTKGAFSSDVALQKLVYLTIQNLHTEFADVGHYLNPSLDATPAYWIGCLLRDGNSLIFLSMQNGAMIL